MNEGGCSAAGQRARHNPQLAKLMVAGASELVDVQGEAELLAKNDSQVKCLERQWQQRTGQHQLNVCHLPAVAICSDELLCALVLLRGHPFMTSTRRGEGVRLRWTHVDGGRGSSPMWTSTQKIKIRVHRRHTVFFSCKVCDVFLPEFRLWTEKKWKFFCD